MTKIIEVERDKVLPKAIDDCQGYIDVLNGIVFDCFVGCNYWRGHRNTVAVDTVVSCYMLGMQYEDILDMLIEEDVVSPSDDDEDTYHRFGKVYDYKDGFCWDYMIDPTYYIDIAHEHKDDERAPILFVLS